MKNYAGFTLVEAILVIGLMAILFGISSITLVQPQAKNSLVVTSTNLIADIKQQQLLAMLGDAGSQITASSHGVRFDANSYTLFTGTNYLGSTNQFAISLPQGITISSTSLPIDLIFAQRSGEPNAIVQITLSDGNGNQKNLTINRLGAINVN